MFSWGLSRTKRERALATRGTLLFHLRPFSVSRRAVKWTHTFGLGGSSLVLWLTLAVSGVLMLFVYVPSPQVAYDSIWTLESGVRFGALVRGIHYWSANLLVVVVLLHTARVVFTGGYHRPRRLNWIIGAGLLLVVLASAFTGYLLPWDQRAFWAVTISTGMLAYVPAVGEGLQLVARGAESIGASTLLSFYTYHTTLLPVLAITLMMFHFWRVRKAKGVVVPAEDEEAGPGMKSREDRAPFLPDLLIREVAQGLAILALVVVLGAFVGAPIGERANPGMSPNPAKAPWYFMGFQELLIHLHPVFAVFILPLAGLAGLVALPWMADDAGPKGRWFISDGARRAAAVAALVGVVASVAGVLVDDVLTTASAGEHGWFARGLIPTVLLAGIVVVLALFAGRRFSLGRNELVQTVVVFVLVAFTALTLIGVFFRGPGMVLSVPWGG